jgi:hypothetical protein
MEGVCRNAETMFYEFSENRKSSGLCSNANPTTSNIANHWRNNIGNSEWGGVAQKQ